MNLDTSAELRLDGLLVRCASLCTRAVLPFARGAQATTRQNPRRSCIVDTAHEVSRARVLEYLCRAQVIEWKMQLIPVPEFNVTI